MSDITVTITPGVSIPVTISNGNLPHNSTHSPSGSDSVAAWYAQTADLLFVSGLINFPTGVVLLTGNQNISGVKDFYSRPTVNGSGVLLSGEVTSTGYLTGYVKTSQTGNFVSAGQTGNFVSTTQTGQLTGAFYPLNANPSGYVQGAVVRPSNTGNFLDRSSVQTVNGQKFFSAQQNFTTGIVLSGIDFGNAPYDTQIAFVNPLTAETGLVIKGGGIDDIGHFECAELEFTSPSINFSSRPFVNGTGVLLSGEAGGNTGAFLTTGASDARYVNLTGNQNITGQKNFIGRAQISGVGVQTTGEFANYNVWTEHSGSLYPYPKNDLNRSWMIQERAEQTAGVSGDTIYFANPQWTGSVPVGTGINSFFNTGFWARNYDWSCVAVRASRYTTGNPNWASTLITPRHIYGAKHVAPLSGDKMAFVSNTETGYTWEATVTSVTNLSGDAFVATLNENAPSQIRPAKILGAPPSFGWEFNLLSNTRVFLTKDNKVWGQGLGTISTGAGGLAGALSLAFGNVADARFTGTLVGGDSSNGLFLPLDDGSLVLAGAAYSASTCTFIADPSVLSGIRVATSGYSLSEHQIISRSVSGVFPDDKVKYLGLPSNPWTSLHVDSATANNFLGNVSEYYLQPLQEFLYGGTLNITSGDYKGITLNTDQNPAANVINFSGSFPDAFFARAIIPKTGSSISFTSSGPTLITPNGSSFSGAGYVIDIRAVDANRILIQPIAVPSGTYSQSSTGYLTGYVQKTETGNFITGVDLSPYATIVFATGISGGLQSQITANNQTGSFLTTGAADNRYALQSATGTFTNDFYPRNNPSGYITGVDLSPYATTSYVTGVSGYLYSQITGNTVNTGSLTGTFINRTGDTMSGAFVITTPTGFTGRLLNVTRSGMSRFSVDEQGRCIISNGTNGLLFKYFAGNNSLILRNSTDTSDGRLDAATLAASIVFGSNYVAVNNAGIASPSFLGNGGGFVCSSGGYIGFNSSTDFSSTVPSAVFVRGSTVSGVMQMGFNHATSGTLQILKGHNVTTGTGADIMLAGGTGSLASGQVILHGQNRANFIADATTGDLQSIVDLLNGLKATAISHGLMKPS